MTFLPTCLLPRSSALPFHGALRLVACLPIVTKFPHFAGIGHGRRGRMSEVQEPQSDDPAAGPGKSGNAWKWWITGVLFLATVLTYLDRQTLAVCKKPISQEFGLNNQQYGELLAAFRWAYALMQIPAGMIAHRFSLRMTYGLAVGLWSLAGGRPPSSSAFPCS